MIKVLIVDDHEIIREGIKRILNEQSDLEVVAETDNGNDVMRIISEKEVDLILLDLNIPGRNGAELIAEIKKKKPKINILILSVSPEQKFAIPSLKAGAAGYVSKDSALTELINAIHRVQANKKYMSMNLAEQLAFETVEENNREQRQLSNLEYCVMLMLARGKENKEIAKELEMSINSVAQNRRKILEKLHLKNNVQLTHYVIENKLLAM